MTNTNLFKATMAIKGKTMRKLAAECGINLQMMSKKVNNHVGFKQTEIAAIARYLKLTPDEIAAIFFGLGGERYVG